MTNYLPTLRFRAVHKETKRQYIFDLSEWTTEDPAFFYDQIYGVVVVPVLRESGKTSNLSIRFLLEMMIEPWDQSTGHKDSEGNEVFGGDVVNAYSGKIMLIRYSHEQARWVRCELKNPNRTYPFDPELLSMETVIGNVHNPAGLPEEVRGLLDGD